MNGIYFLLPAFLIATCSCLAQTSNKNSSSLRAQQSNPSLRAQRSNPLDEPDILKRIYITPTRIVWKSNDSLVVNAELLLEKGTSQAFFENRRVCRIINKGNAKTALIIDFG